MKKKKVVSIPVALVELLKLKVGARYSGDLIEGFLFCLNQNIKILKQEDIIDKDVKKISALKPTVIEYGSITKDILKNALNRVPYQGKKKLIKALVIAAFEAEWLPVYSKYYDEDGELRISEDSDKGVLTPVLHNIKNTKWLKVWNVVANHSTPQWANYIKIPTENGAIRRVGCQLITTSPYYRFGFKLFRATGRLFGDGSIQSMDNNFVIHIGKNFLSPELFVTTYFNGIRQRPDNYTEVKPLNDTIGVELFVDDENMLHLLLDGMEVFKKIINKEIRNQIYMLAWGDGNEFQLRVEKIEIEYEIE
jgi:hypothetical protein